ncbi:MAG: peptide chain release factor N(5)-glutamine methyltransferase [bacterium]
MTTLEVLNAASAYLHKQRVESARLNAEYLLAHVLGRKKRIDLYLEFERPLGEKERAPLRELVKRRSEGIPLQHLLGTAEFCGRTFACDARGLIPRPETEQLVELILKTSPKPESALDVGTGSGVIAITLALSWPETPVSACDVSKDALALARENAARHELLESVTFFESDLLAATRGGFDIIVANLPYIPSADIPTLSREVQNDPLCALDGGPDGLRLVERLIVEAKSRLTPGGLLALEIGHDQAECVMALLAANNYRDIAAHRDYQDFQRFVLARHG